MRTKFDQFKDDNKNFITFYLLWFILQLAILFITWDSGKTEDFWPFENLNIKVYDFTEFIFYLALPLLIFMIWKLNKKDNRNQDKE